MNKSTLGVLLVNLGSPERPNTKSIRKFLRAFLWDKRVIDLPRPLWWCILNFFILPFRPKKIAASYKEVPALWPDGESLLRKISLAQASKLQALCDQHNDNVFVQCAMTYGEPSIKSAIEALQAKQIDKLLVIPMFPQYSATTTAAVFDQLAKVFKQCENLPALQMIKDYYQHPLYINALSKSVREHWDKAGRDSLLLMSFHGIPERYANRGDPYGGQCAQTAKLLATELGLTDTEWLQSFQSRFGPAKWLQPYTMETLCQLAKDGQKRVSVISPGFAADCLETVEELDCQNREAFYEAGGEEFYYIPALNDELPHLMLLRQLILEHRDKPQSQMEIEP